MKKLLYKLNDTKNAEGILLAVFDFEYPTYEIKRKFIFRKRIEKICTQKAYLVFTPFKHTMKSLDILREKDILSEPQFDDSLQIVKADRFTSSNPHNPYEACVIVNFTGCDFVFEDKSFICNAYFADLYSALETLYKRIPSIVDEVFDEEE